MSSPPAGFAAPADVWGRLSAWRSWQAWWQALGGSFDRDILLQDGHLHLPSELDAIDVAMMEAAVLCVSEEERSAMRRLSFVVERQPGPTLECSKTRHPLCETSVRLLGGAALWGGLAELPAVEVAVLSEGQAQLRLFGAADTVALADQPLGLPVDPAVVEALPSPWLYHQAGAGRPPQTTSPTSPEGRTSPKPARSRKAKARRTSSSSPTSPKSPKSPKSPRPSRCVAESVVTSPVQLLPFTHNGTSYTKYLAAFKLQVEGRPEKAELVGVKTLDLLAPMQHYYAWFRLGSVAETMSLPVALLTNFAKQWITERGDQFYTSTLLFYQHMLPPRPVLEVAAAVEGGRPKRRLDGGELFSGDQVRRGRVLAAPFRNAARDVAQFHRYKLVACTKAQRLPEARDVAHLAELLGGHEVTWESYASAPMCPLLKDQAAKPPAERWLHDFYDAMYKYGASVSCKLNTLWDQGLIYGWESSQRVEQILLGSEELRRAVVMKLSDSAADGTLILSIISKRRSDKVIHARLQLKNMGGSCLSGDELREATHIVTEATPLGEPGPPVRRLQPSSKLTDLFKVPGNDIPKNLIVSETDVEDGLSRRQRTQMGQPGYGFFKMVFQPDIEEPNPFAGWELKKLVDQSQCFLQFLDYHREGLSEDAGENLRVGLESFCQAAAAAAQSLQLQPPPPAQPPQPSQPSHPGPSGPSSPEHVNNGLALHDLQRNLPSTTNGAPHQNGHNVHVAQNGYSYHNEQNGHNSAMDSSYC